ncbi:hypothetical protein ACVBIO_13045, partial [Shewanella sp. 0m-8]
SIIHHPSSIIHHPSSIIHHPSSIIHQPYNTLWVCLDLKLYIDTVDMPLINAGALTDFLMEHLKHVLPAL